MARASSHSRWSRIAAWLLIVPLDLLLNGVLSAMILLMAFAPELPLIMALQVQSQRLYEAGKYGDATPIAERALALAEKRFGDSIVVGGGLIKLALILQDLGRYAEAEPLLKRAISIFEKAWGRDDPNFGLSLNNLAWLYARQDRFAEAEPLYKRALSIDQKTFGPDHPSVANKLHNLAFLYMAQGRYADAEPLFKRSLAIEKALGSHRVGESLDNLAWLYQKQGRYAEAEPLLQLAISILEKALGPDHPHVSWAFAHLALVFEGQGRYAEAEAFFKHAIAILEKALGPDHPDVGDELGALAKLHFGQSDWGQAASYWRQSTDLIIRRSRRGSDRVGQSLTGQTKSDAELSSNHFRGLLKAEYRIAIPEVTSTNGIGRQMFQLAQWISGSEVAASLSQMAARRAKGDDDLARLVRERQDLVAEWRGKDKLLTAARSEPPERRKSEAETALSTRLTSIDSRLAEIDVTLKKDFRDYAALASPEPLSIEDVQAQLGDGEALVLFLDTPEAKPTPEETFIWVVTKTEMRWVRTDLGTKGLQARVAVLRCGLDRAGEWQWPDKNDSWIARKPVCASLRPNGLTRFEPLPFDLAVAHQLYKGLFGDVEDLIKDKHLFLVPSGALTSLPFQVLVTAPPAGDDLASAAWLIRDHALTVLPSVASLDALRRPHRLGKDRLNAIDARDPFIGFGNPALLGNSRCGKITIPDKCPDEEIVVAAAAPSEIARSSGDSHTTETYFRNGLADVGAVKTRLCPLPDTAHELKCVARSLGASESSVVLAKDMTETAVKRMSLDRYRVVHFATHGLLAGETAQLAKNQAEPALAFSPPDTATEEDDGLLTASEVAGLKLNADWVVMSACNTASGAEPGAEAFSGLAKAFFYAGARALLVSHWPVNSYAATMLTSRTFAEMKKDPAIGRSEAFRRAMLALLSDKNHPWAANPSVWAPFVVVGEGSAAQASP